MSTFAGPLGLLDGDDDVWCDNFGTTGRKTAPSCFLLSHAHSDHLNGLGQIHNCKVYAHRQTIEYLKVYHDAFERRMHQSDLREPHLMYRVALQSNNFIPVEYDKPYWLDIMEQKKTPVRMVPIDAGHCPGSCLFLVERFTADKKQITRSILFCGDQRCDADYLDKLRTNRWLQPYLKDEACHSMRTLDKIVLDTSAILSHSEVLTKREAISSVIETIHLYPPTTKFFLNAWTTGYEELLLAIAQAFETKIHVDFFKESYMKHGDLKGHITRTATETRFHACEKTWKCDEVWANGRGSCAEFASGLSGRLGTKQKRFVGCGCRWNDSRHKGANCKRSDPTEGLTVYVNPVEPFQRDGYFEHERYTREMIRKALAGEGKARLPGFLLAPWGRHSALPELRRFVGLFRPLEVEPNTIYDRRTCLDYFQLSTYLGPEVLGPGAADCMAKSAKAELTAQTARARSPLQADNGLVGDMRFLTVTRGQQQLHLNFQLVNVADVNPQGVPDVGASQPPMDKATENIFRQMRATAGMPMFSHLEGPPGLQTFVRSLLSGGSATAPRDDVVQHMQNFVKQAVVSKRDHIPAALQADYNWGRRQVMGRTSTPAAGMEPGYPHSPAAVRSRAAAVAARPTKRTACTYILGGSSSSTFASSSLPRSPERRHHSRATSLANLPPRTEHVDMREAVKVDPLSMTERERKRFRSNIARSFRRLMKDHEMQEVSKLTTKVSEGEELLSIIVDSQTLS